MKQNLLARALANLRDTRHFNSLARPHGFKAMNDGHFGQLGGVSNGTMIRRTEERIQLDAVALATDNQPIRIPLNKQSLVEETYVRIQASQLWAGGAPTSVDVRRFITNISLESSDGRRKFMTGHQAYDIGRITETIDAPVTTLGTNLVASTADYMFSLHHENDEALFDAMAFVLASKLNTFDLVIQFAPLLNNGFIGGVTGATPAAAYTVTVRNSNYPGMIHDASGNINTFVEALRHIDEYQTLAGAAGGGTTAPLLRLTAGNKTRFIMFHCFDTTGTNPVPSDAVISNLRLVINGQERRITTYTEQQKRNAADRGLYVKGLCWLDFGDDEAGFLDLRGVAEPYMSWDIAAGTPATWRVDFCQDYSIIMK